MSEKAWTLEEIRKAYREILRSWNALFPLYMREKIEMTPDGFDVDRDKFWLETFSMKYKEVIPKLRRAADQSGGAQTWRRGDPLDGLSQELRDRVERALRYGI